MKKFFLLVMIFTLFISTFSLSVGSSEASAASMKPVPGSSGWKYRVEGPHIDGVNNDWHVHVEKGKVKGAERVTGGKSHKKTLNSSNVPKAVQKNVKSTADFKKALEKQKKLDKERKKVSKMSWNHIFINPAVVAPIAILIGFTVAKLLKFPKLIFA